MRLHLVDGTFELFRAHYAPGPDRRAPDGAPAKAVTGVVSQLLTLLADPAEAVTHLAVAFDRPIESFRNELFAGYKTGAGMDPELVAQMIPAEEALRALGITVWVMDRWEADDAMATAAARFRDQVDQVRLLTPDKDLKQCLRGGRVVQVDRIRGRELTEACLLATRGFGPASIPDYLALVGDTADGIPGVPGFGEKTAARLLARYGHLERIPGNPAAWDGIRGAARLADTLRARREDALLYRRLATLVEDVPLSEDLEALRWLGAPRDAFLELCDRLGSRGLRERPVRWRD